MKIWDLHCHLSGVDGQTPAQRIAQIMEIADREDPSASVPVEYTGQVPDPFREGRESPLAELPVQYADFAAWQREARYLLATGVEPASVIQPILA